MILLIHTYETVGRILASEFDLNGISAFADREYTAHRVRIRCIGNSCSTVECRKVHCISKPEARYSTSKLIEAVELQCLCIAVSEGDIDAGVAIKFKGRSATNRSVAGACDITMDRYVAAIGPDVASVDDGAVDDKSAMPAGRFDEIHPRRPLPHRLASYLRGRSSVAERYPRAS